MALPREELRAFIVGRTVDLVPAVEGSAPSRMTLQLRRPLDALTAGRLVRELDLARAASFPGLLTPEAAELSPERVQLFFPAVAPGVVQLAALTAGGRGLGSPLAAAVIATVASAVHQLHELPGLEGPRVHGELHGGVVLISPEGALTLVGSGLLVSDALFLAGPADEAARYRLLAPEAARGEPVDARADVYALGVLYFELLAGRPHRPDLLAAGLAEAALAGLEPDVPGALPEPRPSLQALLRRALAPHPGHRFEDALTFGEAVLEELAGAGLAPGSASELAGLVRGLPPEIPRGLEALVPQQQRSTSPRAQPLPPEAPLARPSPSSWDQVLGEPIQAPATQATPAAPVPSAAPARAPEAAALAKLTLPPRGAAQAPRRRLPSEALRSVGLTPAVAREEEPRRAPAGKRRALAMTGALLVAVAGGLAWLARSPSPSPNVPEAREATLPEAAPPERGEAAPRGFIDRTAVPDAPRPIGLLTVMSQPSGAAVEVDGGYVGTTPLVHRHRFERRAYVVRVLADGYLPWERHVFADLQTGSISLTAVLERSGAR